MLRYFEAVEAINATIEQAVQSGSLVVRHASTGIPMQALPARGSEPAKAFGAAVLNADAMRTQVFRAAAELLLNLPLLDDLPHEGVAVRLAEFDEWAARAGIAEVGEVPRLLQDADARMWQQELAYHAELARLAQDEQAEATARADAADRLKRLQANARAGGRIIDADSGPTPEQEGIAPLPSPAIAGASIGTVTRKLKTKRHALGHIIEMAKQAASEPENYQSVWAELVRLASCSKPHAPLIGYVDGEGVKYQAEKVKFFTKDALRKQMEPNAR